MLHYQILLLLHKKNIKKLYKKMNLKYRLQDRTIDLNYLVDHTQ